MTNDKHWAEQVAARLKKKYSAVMPRNAHKVPYSAENGVFDDQSGDRIGWWTNGFWGGMLWQLYAAEKNPLYKAMAEELEEKMDANLLNTNAMSHDSGFRWLPTSVADYELTGSKAAKNRAILAADNLAGRFNLAGKFIRAWNGNSREGLDRTGWAIIDCMMNLPLLYWASEELGDPRYYQIAVAHADTAAKNIIREDGSSKHIVEFNPSTGEYVKCYGGQGIAEDTSWTRGQSWALYGFTLTFMHTKEKRFLDLAQKIADRYIERIPENGLIPVDFDQPAEITWRDDTSAAISACGLLELEKFVSEDKAFIYHAAAMKLLHALDEESCDYSEEHDELLTKCTAAYHDEKHEFPIIYGDYYYLEAIFKLTDEDIFIW